MPLYCVDELLERPGIGGNVTNVAAGEVRWIRTTKRRTKAPFFICASFGDASGGCGASWPPDYSKGARSATSLLSNHLHQHSFWPSIVELAVENWLPGAEVELEAVAATTTSRPMT